MRIDAYPPQEPVPAMVTAFHETVMLRGQGIEGHEFSYGDDPSQSLIVYPSERPGGPVLLFMHGGGWTNGYKEQMTFLAPPLNAAGITLVTSGYRLAPKYIFPANFEDACKAVAMVWGVAKTFDYDRDALFVGGHSAGGHLASLLAVRSDWQARRGLPENLIKGCLPLSATFDFTPGSGASARPRFLGPEGTLSEVAASPLFQLRDTAPPFFVTHGSKDFPHLVTQSRQFVMVARAKGIEVEALEIDEAGHLEVVLAAGDPDYPWLDAATGWMKAIGAKQATVSSSSSCSD